MSICELRRDELNIIFLLFLVISVKGSFRLIPTLIFAKKVFFSQFSTKIRVGTSCNEFSRVKTSSVKARKTRSDPSFRKTAISETRENKNFGKNVFRRALVYEAPWIQFYTYYLLFCIFFRIFVQRLKKVLICV